MSRIWSFRQEQLESYIKPYMQEHGIKNRTQALVKMLEERKTLSEKNEGLLKAIDMLRLNESDDFSNQACKFLDYDSNGKAFCRNKKAPIDTHDLTPKACMVCSSYETLKVNPERRTKQSTSVQKQRYIDYTLREDMTKRLEWINKHCLRNLTSRQTNDDSYCHDTCKLLDVNRYEACMQLYNEWKQGKHVNIKSNPKGSLGGISQPPTVSPSS